MKRYLGLLVASWFFLIATACGSETEAPLSPEEQKVAASQYVDRIDPAARVAQPALREIRTFGEDVAAGGTPKEDAQVYFGQIKDVLNPYESILISREPPAHLEKAVDDLTTALDQYRLAGETLLSVSGPGESESMTRFRQVYDRATMEYNGALGAIYQASAIAPPFV